MTDRLRAVVVGTKFGARVHARALQVAGFEILSLVGRDLERTGRVAAKAGALHADASLEDALARGPDVVVVATPPATHAPFALAAIEAGCHVMCEKPFTLDQGEAEQLRARAEQAGRVGYLSHEFRFAECAALTERLLAEGAIGTPQLASFVAHGGLVADPATAMPDWWFDPARGGGWLGASGSHAVDRLLHWFGDVVAVSGRTVVAGRRPPGSADDSFDVRFSTPSGVEGVVSSTAAAHGEPHATTRIVGDEGTLWIEDHSGIGSVESTLGPVLIADGSGTRTVPVPDDLALRPIPGLDPRFARNVGPFVRLYEQMASAIVGAALPHPTPPATFADGHREMQILDAIRASSAGDGELRRLPART